MAFGTLEIILIIIVGCIWYYVLDKPEKKQKIKETWNHAKNDSKEIISIGKEAEFEVKKTLDEVEKDIKKER